MDINELFELGIKKNIITSSQRDELINLIDSKDSESTPAPLVVRIMYYIGGFIMLCAMIYLMSHTIQHSSYFVILILGTVYAGLFLSLGEFLWKRNEKFPAGILYFLFITSIAFIITDIEKMTGFFPRFSDFDRLENFSELCRMPIFVVSIFTIISNTILQKFRNSSILAIPTITSSYSIFIICLNYLIGSKNWGIEISTWAGLIFAVALIIIAFIKDRLAKADYSKWMYLFGAIGLYQALIFIFNDYFNSEVAFGTVQIQVFILSTIYFIFGTIIQRKPFTIIGILGIIEYIMYLEFHYIKNNTTLLTSTILITGLLILYAGVLYNKNSDKIITLIEKLLPEKTRKYLPSNR